MQTDWLLPIALTDRNKVAHAQIATPSSPVSRLALPLAFAVFLLATSLWHMHIIDRAMPFNLSDLLSRWAGTRVAIQGGDPYSPAQLRPILEPYTAHPEPFLYPATVVILLAPLAPLSMETARLVFLSIVFPLLMLSLWLCLRSLPISTTSLQGVLTMLMALVSWAALWGLRMQQPTLLVVSFIFIAWFLLARGHEIAPGILLALATVKPQLVLPLLLWLLLWAVTRRHWSLIGSFAATLAALLIATERVVPGWFWRWRMSLRNYGRIEHAAPLLEHILGHSLGLSLTLLLAPLGALALWRIRRCSADSPMFALALSLALAVTLCLFPTQPLMIYNNVLLFPAVLILVFRKPQDTFAARIRYLALAQLTLDFVLVPVATLGEIISKPSTFWLVLPYMDFLLPALLTALFVVEILRCGSQSPLLATDAGSWRKVLLQSEPAGFGKKTALVCRDAQRA